MTEQVLLADLSLEPASLAAAVLFVIATSLNMPAASQKGKGRQYEETPSTNHAASSNVPPATSWNGEGRQYEETSSTCQPTSSNIPATPRKCKGRRHEETPSIYQPLPRGRFTRVLILEPGIGNQMIFGKLEVIDIDDNPDFEAISYVWGSKKKQRTIFCIKVAIKITQNLFEALRRIRNPSEQRTVWADAICINQDDIAERGHQVAFMGHLYSRARKVLIHIAGDDEGHAACAASLVADVGCMAHITLKDIGPGFDHFPWPDLKMRGVAMEDSRWFSLQVLCEQPWFYRGWVIQEAGLAQDASIIWGAQAMIDWQAFMRCCLWYCFRLRPAHFTISVYIPVCHDTLYCHRNPGELSTYGRSPSSAPPLLALLYLASGTASFTDPRDRIFAFADVGRYLGGGTDHLDECTSSMESLSLDPDYARSAGGVFTDFANRYLQTKGVELLESARHVDASVPSWVPTWDKDMVWACGPTWGPGISVLLPEPPPELVAGRHIFRGRFVDEEILVFRGIIIDAIEGSPMMWSAKDSGSITPAHLLSTWSATWSKRKTRHAEIYHLAERFMYSLHCGLCTRVWVDWYAAQGKHCTLLTRWAEGGDDCQ